MLATLVTICCLSVGHALPIVDPGLFVIMGVSSCREGSGYCLLGLDCTLDEDFLPDDEGGHCNGLRSAFTPSANFICCRYNSDRDSSLNATSVILDNHLMDSIPAILLSMDSENANSNEVDDDSTEMEYLTTETYKTTTTVEELPKNALEEESRNQVQLKSKADNSLASVAVLSHLPSVTEINLELVVHDNIHERSVNNESTSADVTTVESPDQDEGYTSTMDTSSENYNESEFTTQQQNMEELATTVANVEQALNVQSRLAAITAENDSEVKEFETVSGSFAFTTSTEDYTTVAQEEASSQSEDSIETSSINIDLERKSTTTELDFGTTEPFRHNEIPAEPEETSTTTPCSATAGKNCWLVKFMNGTDVMCLGSFLRNNIILTAANCVARVFDVGLGGVTLQTLGGTVIPRNVIRDVIVHEEYNMKSIDVALNDIGMVRLESASKLTPSICTLCVPDSESDLMDKSCDRISKKYNNKKILGLPGSPMVCQGSTLGGVVSFYNPEPVYTPITDYLPWLRHNMDIINIPLEWQR